jgi:hypothetical protein
MTTSCPASVSTEGQRNGNGDGDGLCSLMCAENGVPSYLPRSRDLIYGFSAHPRHPSNIIVKRTWSRDDWDNTIAALQQRNRVCEIDLNFSEVFGTVRPHGTINKLAASMQESFPILDRLSFSSSIGVECANSFLGGFAPRLRVLCLDTLCYKGFKLPPILSSATHLVELQLERIHSTECISSEALVVALSALVRLKTLYLQFIHVTSRSSNLLPPSPTSMVSSTLLQLTFKGPRNDIVTDIGWTCFACSTASRSFTLPECTLQECPTR